MDELAAVGDPELRSALLYARGRELPVTADELAAAQGVHRNVARSRLERLVEAGLLATGSERRSGRSGPGAGRPAKTYRVTPALEPVEFPPRRTEALVGRLLDELPVRGRDSRLRHAGSGYGSDLARAAQVRPARSLAAGAERLCVALRRLGYQAAVQDVTESTVVISTPTCPLRPLVRARRDAVAVDRGMWAGLAAASFAGIRPEDVRCDTCDCFDDRAECRVVIELPQTPF